MGRAEGGGSSAAQESSWGGCGGCATLPLLRRMDAWRLAERRYEREREKGHLSAYTAPLNARVRAVVRSRRERGRVRTRTRSQTWWSTSICMSRCARSCTEESWASPGGRGAGHGRDQPLAGAHRRAGAGTEAPHACVCAAAVARERGTGLPTAEGRAGLHTCSREAHHTAASSASSGTLPFCFIPDTRRQLPRRFFACAAEFLSAAPMHFSPLLGAVATSRLFVPRPF
jgi:hypothetical protein